MEVYTLTLEDFTKYANIAKEIVVSSLAKEGYLTEEQAEEILGKYTMLTQRKGFLGSVIDKVRGLEADKLTFILLKTLPL